MWVISLVALMVLSMISVAVRAEHYDVFLLAGQSNMDGRAKGSELVGELARWKEPQGDVRIAYSNSTMGGRKLHSEGWVKLEPGFSVAPLKGEKVTEVPSGTFGPEVSFGRAMADGLGKEHHVAIIKFSVGGTSLEKDWVMGEKGKLYDQMIAYVGKVIGDGEKSGDTYTLRGFVWHQGESDSKLSEEAYEKLLTELIGRVRGDLNAYEDAKDGTLPVVVGEVFDNHERDTVIAAERAVGTKLERVAVASAAGMKTIDAGTHFDTAGQIEMGKRMAEGMTGLLAKK